MKLMPYGSRLWKVESSVLFEGRLPKLSQYIKEAGAEVWWDNGELHREDGPAFTLPNGQYRWFHRNKCHRIGGPAAYDADDDQTWQYFGILHRENGPAVIRPGGYEGWYINGLLHRLDGPAIICNGQEEWWINDINVDEEVERWITENSLPARREWGIAEKTLFALRFR